MALTGMCTDDEEGSCMRSLSVPLVQWANEMTLLFECSWKYWSCGIALAILISINSTSQLEGLCDVQCPASRVCRGFCTNTWYVSSSLGERFCPWQRENNQSRVRRAVLEAKEHRWEKGLSLDFTENSVLAGESGTVSLCFVCLKMHLRMCLFFFSLKEVP